MKQQMQQQEQVGRVFSYKPLLGFGFIYYSDTTIFFHKNDSEYAESLVPGDEVKFILAKDFRGRPCAKNVRLIGADKDGDAK